MEYYSSIWAPTDSLSHHGIKGMKWGVRRYQNADGSLTAAGRKRYYGSADKIQKDIDSFKGHEKGIYDKKGRTLLSETDVRNSVKALEIARDKAKQKGDAKRNKDYQKINKIKQNQKEKKSFLKRAFDKSIEKSVANEQARQRNRREEIKTSVKKQLSEEDQSSIESIKKMGKDLAEESNALYPVIGKKLDSMKLDPKSKMAIEESLKRDFGDGVDDEELFDFYKEEYTGYEILEKLYKMKSLKEFQKHTEDYWNQVESYTDDFVKRHADDKLTSYEIDTTYKNAVYDYLDTTFPSYMYRHFDDYWVYDRPEYTAAVERMAKEISYEDVFKKHPGE